MTAAPPVITDVVRFRVNGRTVEARVPGGRRLLDVLRLDLGLTGTKEGCGEGECGACSVLLDGDLVNSCLLPLSQVDGRDVETVEGLAAAGRLDPVQRAFLEHGAVQCGACTPGMLLAAHALIAGGGTASEPAIREAIAGNLCRCTGYSKIIDAIAAASGAMDAPSSGRGDPAPDGAVEPDAAGALVEDSSEWAGPRVVRPTSLFDALARLAAHPDLRPIAGGTDVMVELASGTARATHPLLDLWDLEELRGIAVESGELVVGSLTTFAELRASSRVREALPALAEAAASVGAVQVRNRGTIGGNCVTASPAGDLLPVLLAAGARMEVAASQRTRHVPASSFWPGYRETALGPGELLVAIRIPLVPGRRVRFRKVGTRRAQAISKVVMAVAWRPDQEGRWDGVRVAIGSVAPTPVLAPHAEAVLEGALPSRALADRAAEAVQEDIWPIDDVRSSAAYRRAVTGRVLRRIVLDAAG